MRFKSPATSCSRALKRGTAVVDEGDPAVKIGGLIFPPNRENVIRVPRKIACKIGSFNLLLARPGIFKRHQQRRAVEQIRGNFREAIGLGIAARDNVVADFPDWPVVVRKQGCLDLFAFRRSVVHVRANERNFFAHVFVQQLGRLKQIVFVVLFENA